MPCLSQHMQYLCANDTHCVHAQKLAKDDYRSIFNKGEVNIKWQAVDTEGAGIIDQELVFAIYDRDSRSHR